MTQAVTGVIAAFLLVAVVLVWHHGPRSAIEDLVWRYFSAAAGVIALGTLAAFAVDLAAGSRAAVPAGSLVPLRAGDLVFGSGLVIGCALFFLGLVRWHEIRIGDRDPGELVNAFSSVLVAVAMGNLIVPHLPGQISQQPQWQLQVGLWTCACAMLAFGTTLTIAGIGGMFSDLRIGLIIAATAAGMVSEVTTLAVGGPARPLDRLVWLLAAAVVVATARLAPATDQAPASARPATIVGALFVLLAGVTSLTLNNDLALNGGHLATAYAAVGVLGASMRVVRLTQDLAHLAQSRHEAMTDELTGIANRRALLAAIDEALRTAASTSLLIVDLDRFKAINDRFGHAAGDRMLRYMSKVFARHVPPGGVLARLGGDEFAVVLTDGPPGQAVEVARSLAQAAAPLSDVKGRLLQVGASVGVATIDVPGATGGELLRRADAAMYQAKASGSGVRVYDSALDAAAQQRVDLIEDLHVALEGTADEKAQIVVYFQPQLNMTTGAVTGAEALVRWQHPRHGLLAPDTFIELAETNGMMPSLTARVLVDAVAQAGRWRQAGYGLRVSVNLSASCLGHARLLPLIDLALEGGLPAANLVLEVTETSLMIEPELALAAMHSIAERGVGISIDDYGTGYSSLSYMNTLPATELKIDRSFTATTVSDARTAAIVAGTVELAHRLGMRLVAEGVEDEATLTAMRELGCDESQGYLHSRPLPADGFLCWLQDRSARAAAAGPGAGPAWVEPTVTTG